MWRQQQLRQHGLKPFNTSIRHPQIPSRRDPWTPKRKVKIPENGSWPVAQIAPDSFLGIVLRSLERQHREPSDKPTSSSSSSTGSDSDESQSYNSLYSSVPRRHQPCQWWNRSKVRLANEETTLKPIPSRIYDGLADAWAYHWFICKGEAYLQDRRVKGTQRRVFTWLHFLEGKAYDFYTQKVVNRTGHCLTSSKNCLIIASL